MTNSLPFWKTKKLSEMSQSEWESLCDGCGRCCLHKIEDVDTGKIYYTNIACSLLDPLSCSCKDYQNRKTVVEGCIILTPKNISELKWMPTTCAYRLLYEGKDLEWWHPLVSGSTTTVHSAGMSVRWHAVSETDININNLEDYITSCMSPH